MFGPGPGAGRSLRPGRMDEVGQGLALLRARGGGPPAPPRRGPAADDADPMVSSAPPSSSSGSSARSSRPGSASRGPAYAQQTSRLASFDLDPRRLLSRSSSIERGAGGASGLRSNSESLRRAEQAGLAEKSEDAPAASQDEEGALQVSSAPTTARATAASKSDLLSKRVGRKLEKIISGQLAEESDAPIRRVVTRPGGELDWSSHGGSAASVLGGAGASSVSGGGTARSMASSRSAASEAGTASAPLGRKLPRSQSLRMSSVDFSRFDAEFLGEDGADDPAVRAAISAAAPPERASSRRALTKPQLFFCKKNLHRWQLNDENPTQKSLSGLP